MQRYVNRSIYNAIIIITTCIREYIDSRYMNVMNIYTRYILYNTYIYAYVYIYAK